MSYQEPEEPTAPKTTVPKHPPVTQPSKPKSGGGLFSDEDEEEAGGLFGGPATKSSTKTENKTKAKPKSTISLFDEDEQDEEEDFFAAPVTSKPSRYCGVNFLKISFLVIHLKSFLLFFSFSFFSPLTT